MSKKYVMIPWERFQSLTALEKNDFNTPPQYSTGGAAVKASNEHSLDEPERAVVDHTTGGAAVQALQLQQQPAAAETTAAVVNRSGEGAAAAVPEEEEEEEEEEESEKSVEDISLLKPPGVPAKRWLTWN